ARQVGQVVARVGLVARLGLGQRLQRLLVLPKAVLREAQRRPAGPVVGGQATAGLGPPKRLAEQVWPRAAVADHGAAGLAEARGLVPVALGQVQGLTADLVAYPLVIAHQLQHVAPGQWA